MTLAVTLTDTAVTLGPLVLTFGTPRDGGPCPLCPGQIVRCPDGDSVFAASRVVRGIQSKCGAAAARANVVGPTHPATSAS